MINKLIILFKFIEPIFWLAQVWLLVHLVNPRPAFKNNLKIINWFLNRQGFSAKLPFEEKAFKIWRRDLWILFWLNPLVIVLIHLI